MSPGSQLRRFREQLGFSVREVEAASQRIASRHGNEEYAISISRLSDIETKGTVPNIFRIYALAAIYRREVAEILRFYGVELEELAADGLALEPRRSHLLTGNNLGTVRMPVQMDPGFDLRRTTNIGRMIERWGVVPLAYLQQFAGATYTYGFIGTEDFTMYPLVMPGSFVQVNEAYTRVREGMWRSEFERPIYFVETREGFVCCWCAVAGDRITLQPHPLSPVPVRILRYPQEAEVVGQVVGVAMRLDAAVHEPPPNGKSRPVLN